MYKVSGVCDFFSNFYESIFVYSYAIQNIGRNSDFKIEFHRKQAKIKTCQDTGPIPILSNFFGFYEKT